MRTKKTYPSAHVGTPLLLVLLFTLCLSALAVLTLSDAFRNESYSKKVADNTKKYYEADTQAKEQLAQIQSILETETNYEQMRQQLEYMDTITLEDVENEDYFCISYDVSIREDLALHVALNVYKENAAAQGYYQITHWQEISLAEWNTTTTLPVLGSD